VFTREEALLELGTSDVAFKLAALRLAKKRRLAMPRRGFFVIVPMEYSSAGAPPATWFVDDLMKFHEAHYYVGLVTAAALHGAGHQQPQEFQIVTDKQLRPATAGRNRLRFFLKRESTRTPTKEERTETGTVRVSTPEATAFDLVRYEARLGGLSSIATVLSELSERLDGHQLVEAAGSDVELSVIQRTGYLLDQVGGVEKTGPLAEWLATARPRVTPLCPRKGPEQGNLDPRWSVVVNATFEVDE
jgi:predicted transcriptional regulator of viral defense system